MGARPAIYRLATELGLVGEVRNSPQGIEIQIEGSPQQIVEFKNNLRSRLPEEAHVSGEFHRDAPLSKTTRFSIIQDKSKDAVVTSIPMDVSVCHECLTEVRRPGDRRFRYPFNSCAKCGPRYSIIRQMPFEREATAMANFPWCADCLAEYRSVDDRRFHAQTISCPRCGPRLWMVTPDGQTQHDQEEVLDFAARAILCGQIVALKGLGGYQLLVDATNSRAVERLRRKKGRPSKPFAVMTRTWSDAEQVANIDAVERQALTSAANPIVILNAKKNSSIAQSIHPALDTIGVLLPTTPLHDLLIERVGRPLVCTSGNREGNPLAFEVEQAEAELADLCDLWLHHNRPIVRPIDDSVVRVIQGQSVALRLARGLAPLRLEIDAGESVIALGGQMKSAIAWNNGGSAFLGPHIGDVSNLASQERYRWQLADWQALYRLTPSLSVCDRHPEYFTSQLAAKLFPQVEAVQHHHAHVAAAILEHQLLDSTVLGVAWDGTGYGTDQTVWGGEFLLVAGKTFERFGHLRPFTLPGGEIAIREPWRIAISLLGQSGGIDRLTHTKICDDGHLPVEMIERIGNNPRFSPTTTSAGRLLDGLASLILRREQCEYEGQLPMILEAIAEPDERGTYRIAIDEGAIFELDWRPLVRQLCDDLTSGVSPGRMAMRVHRGLANALVALCRRRAELPIVLTGGVFQNRLLSELIATMASEANLAIYFPGVVPPGDGGLAAGQLVLGLCK